MIFAADTLMSRAGVLVSEVEGESEEDMQCHCSVLHDSSFSSTSHVLELRFVAEEMKANQDYRDFGFQGSFRFINTYCTDSTVAR